MGTNAGLVPNLERSEPANLLRHGDKTVLVDAGDGAAEQLIKAGVPLTKLHTVIINHLHFDHTAGLFAIVALRYQIQAPGQLTVYGPPGTKSSVRGFLAAMHTSPPAGARTKQAPQKTVNVIEVGDGAKFRIGDIAVSAVANSHYSATPGGDPFVSLSYRFDLPRRSIAYTGDTGPSAKLEKLATGADTLISEIIDPDALLARLARTRPDMTAVQLDALRPHFFSEHLPPEQVGLLAAHARIKSVVLTHSDTRPEDSELLRPQIAAKFGGPIAFARDMDCF